MQTQKIIQPYILNALKIRAKLKFYELQDSNFDYQVTKNSNHHHTIAEEVSSNNSVLNLSTRKETYIAKSP